MEFINNRPYTSEYINKRCDMVTTINANRKPTREELVNEAREVFSDPKRVEHLTVVERARNPKTGTTVSIMAIRHNTKGEFMPKTMTEKLFPVFTMEELLELKPRELFNVSRESIALLFKNAFNFVRRI